MAATIPVETESGTYSGRVHPHNGYYAGDFSTSRTVPERLINGGDGLCSREI